MKKVLFLLIFLFFFANPAQAKEKKIRDNSFLIEEAYNQEDGVIQHTNFFSVYQDEQWIYSFTQEWPVPGVKNQLSYTIPVFHMVEDETNTGLGDIALSYRYQLVYKGPFALAPRLSLLFPTGNSNKGLGTGAFGVQINIPFSVELGDHFVTHWNAGFTATPNAKGMDGHKTNAYNYNLGASVIWLALSNFNVMLETSWTSNDNIDDIGTVDRENNVFINPGIRMAADFKCGLQIVPGIGAPVSIGPSWHSYGVLFYLSFEHPLF